MPVGGIDPSVAAQATGARTRLSDNYDTFLVLLTAQLQNQDPLAPMDSTQFTQQLVQFSQVEQQIRTNEQLEGLVTQYQASSAGAALSYLGRDAIVEGSTATLAGGAANWAYNLESDADRVTLTVRDLNNRDVFTAAGLRGAGDHLFTWDGKNSLGEEMPDGVYKLVISAKDAAGESVETQITVRETIRGVDFTGSEPLVLTSSGTRPLGSIRAVLDQN